MRKLKLRGRLTLKTALLYLALQGAMLLLNCALPKKEPAAFALFFAALFSGLNPYVCGVEYLISSLIPLSLNGFLSALAQSAFCVLVFALYRRFHKTPRLERLLYAAVAQLPFVFLFPHTGYELLPLPVLAQKGVIAAFFVLLTALFEGGFCALLKRAFRCRLSGARLFEICLMGVFLGLGILGAFPLLVYVALSLAALLFCVLLVKDASALPVAVVLALPLSVTRASLLPVAMYALASCTALLFAQYGKITASLSLALIYLGGQALEGLYSEDAARIAYTLLACLVPVVALICVPERAYARLSHTLLFYRERSLPRVAVNRSRRAVGEQLYEVSSLFREIETAFTEGGEVDTGSDLKAKLLSTMCADCAHRRRCENAAVHDDLEKLIAVGKAKGRVNLVDLPASVSAHCANAAGMLFALNKLLAEYHRYLSDVNAANEGRRLLAEQAHGVSEILRDIALEQSEEYVFGGGERTLSRAFAAAGLIVSEIFLYGEGSSLTVNVTLPREADGKKLCTVAGKALGVPLSLAEKIPLTDMSTCYVLRRKANFDAAFGIAARPKDGETYSGDTHSVTRIDERSFLIALSDGMGSGEEARNVSDRALTLLESFYKAKMPSETVLSTVNRLIAYSSKESFSCLDLAAVNLDTGNADIVKIGSPAGYLISGEELRVLEGASLPMGMLEAVHPATMRVSMKENDFLLFMSDGVSSAFGSGTELCAYLSALRPLNPQSLAEEVLNSALARYKGKAGDDMTVLAVKLMKSA